MDCGIGDNGGSKTLIQSANTLVDLGNDVIFVDNGRNQHTWNPLKAKHLIIKDYTQIPEADVIIATGIKTVDSTDKCNIKNKYHWIRAHETWELIEKDVIRIIKESPSLKIVNSICLQNKLKQFNINSTIIRPGYDFNESFPLNIRNKNSKIVLGGLHCSKGRKRIYWIFESFKRLRKKFDMELYMYGTEKPSSLVSLYEKNPNPIIKNNMYNKIDIWMAPTNSEGLHMPPAEAGLTECCVVATNSELSGTQDYITNLKTGLVSDDNLESFIEAIQKAIDNKDLRYELGKNLRNKILELGNREDNMKELIKVFENECNR